MPAGTDLVFDNDGAVGDRTQLLGKKTDQHVGATARGKRADEANVLIRILLSKRAAYRPERADQCQSPDGTQQFLPGDLHLCCLPMRSAFCCANASRSAGSWPSARNRPSP